MLKVLFQAESILRCASSDDCSKLRNMMRAPSPALMHLDVWGWAALMRIRYGKQLYDAADVVQ